MKLSAWKQSEKIPVIYGLHNLVTNKWYIGSCHNLQDRLHRHYYHLTHNIHHSIKLQRSWNKYGNFNFEAVILKKLDDSEIKNIFTIEESFIKIFNSKEDGYNILDICKPVFKFSQTPENAKKAGLTHAKSIYAIDRFTGKVIGEYSSITKASIIFHESTSNISQVCKHKLRYCKDTVFIYKEEYNPSIDYRVLNHHMKGIAKTEEWKIKARRASKRARKVYMYDLENNLIKIYISRSDAERDNNFKKEFLRFRLDKPINGYIFTHEIKDIV